MIKKSWKKPQNNQQNPFMPEILPLSPSLVYAFEVLLLLYILVTSSILLILPEMGIQHFFCWFENH